MSAFIERNIVQRTLHLQLNRPEKRNAITGAMYEDLARALADASQDSGIYAVVLEGQPEIFTSGHDLADFLSSPPSTNDHPVLRFIDALIKFNKPLIAAVDGAAIGIGTTLLLHCDLVAASVRASFQMPFVALGVVPEAGSSFLLPQVVGLKRASEWLLCSKTLTAADAYESGLLNVVVEPEELPSVVAEWTDDLSSRDLDALIETKRLLLEPRRAALEEAIRQETKAFQTRLAHPGVQARLSAFLGRAKA
jgi:enoyl-CoA hydratase/carnithine racemase